MWERRAVFCSLSSLLLSARGPAARHAATHRRTRRVEDEHVVGVRMCGRGCCGGGERGGRSRTGETKCEGEREPGAGAAASAGEWCFFQRAPPPPHALTPHALTHRAHTHHHHPASLDFGISLPSLALTLSLSHTHTKKEGRLGARARARARALVPPSSRPNEMERDGARHTRTRAHAPGSAHAGYEGIKEGKRGGDKLWQQQCVSR